MNINDLKYPILIGHRGYKKNYPENTTAAFQATIQMGVPMIELDINLSQDGELIVIHDATLERTTSGVGAVHDSSLQQLKQLDTGSWFHPQFTGQRLSTLKEILELTREQIAVNIEVKMAEDLLPDKIKLMATKLVNLVQSLSLESRVLISSFIWPVLSVIHQQDPSLRLGVLSKDQHISNLLDICSSLQAFSWNSNYQNLDAKQVAIAKAQGLKIFTYTVNDPLDARRLSAMGVDGFFTDDLQIKL